MKIGLALGGGSARGLAHIPMLEVFDELGVKPTIIAGCSIGSLIGAGYAAGMSAAEIRSWAEERLASRFQTMRYVFGSQRTRLRDILALKGLGSLQIKAEKLVGLSFPDRIPKKFEDLVIPFKVVTTDYDARKEHVISSGNLLTAVAASIAIPGVFVGPKIGGRVHVDGGVTNPVPFDHARKGCDIVVAIDVTGRPRPPARAHHSNMELAVGSMLIMFHQLAQLRHAADPPDIYIEPEIANFRGVDFFKLKELFEAAQPAKEQLKRELAARLEKLSK